jgi:NAD+ synthase (glutamine-hydrolysing)
VVRIALGQLNTTVGDLDGNVERLADAAARATAEGADVVVFTELAITGYQPEDLVLRSSFVTDNLAALDALASATASGCDVIVGFVDRSAAGLHNAAAVLRGGRVHARYAKVKLPNYGVFDERRTFAPGVDATIVDVSGTRVGVSICEDAWYPGLPFDDYRGVPIVANLNGSPYHRGKADERLDVLRARAAETGAWIVYVNAVGGQDELVFDGGSLIVAPDGSVPCRAARFDEDLLVATIDDGEVRADERPPWPEEPEDVYRALQLGTHDYVRKNGFAGVVLGLSGGIDSALVATIAADALGPDAVHTLGMPSMHSSRGSIDDAADIARRLGITFEQVPITDVYRAYESQLSPEVVQGLAAENLQARIRGNDLMALSNRYGWLVLATGNKSEYAVGYSTLYGDMAGGFAPIKDVPKTLVYDLCRWRNEAARSTGAEPPIPDAVLTKPPSAELRPDQQDTDSLPPYEELDPIIAAYVEDDLGIDEIVAAGIGSPDTVTRVAAMIDRAEYKRRQAAPGVKITPKAFGKDRRLPITNRYVGHHDAG